jgi:hypothetical protein
MPLVRFLSVSILCLAALAGCGDEHAFVGDTGFFAFAMDTSTPPYVATEEATLYLVEARVGLPIEPPTDDQLARLGENIGTGHPYPRRPWVEWGDIALEIDWTISNLEDQPVDVAVTLNGLNEFHEYFPGFTVDDEEVIVDFSQWERTLELEPLERRSGTIREEEIDEVTVDLATVANGAPNSNLIVYFENQYDHDERSMMYIPSIVPGLTGIRMGIRAMTGCEMGACRLVLEMTVRARDVTGKLAERNHETWEVPAPAPFVPIVVEP